MGRIYDTGRGYVDLSNIKFIDQRDCGNGDCYVRIHLLHGYEYVYNSETEHTELMKPIIEVYLSDKNRAASFIEYLTEEWGKYLESKEDTREE